DPPRGDRTKGKPHDEVRQRRNDHRETRYEEVLVLLTDRRRQARWPLPRDRDAAQRRARLGCESQPRRARTGQKAQAPVAAASPYSNNPRARSSSSTRSTSSSTLAVCASSTRWGLGGGS